MDDHGHRISRYNYIVEDVGAWNAMYNAYGAYNVSCANKSSPYKPCNLRYGPENLTQYACQAKSCAGVTQFYAGQCKAVTNLVLYRSGVYHGQNWAFRTLPRDANLPKVAVKLTPAALRAGDVLRSTAHATSVVRVLSNPTRAVVFDSNFLGGDGTERIGTHILSFLQKGQKGYGTASDLNTYYDLDCVYKTTGQC